MPFTDTGFIPLRQSEIIDQLNSRIRSKFGDEFNVDPNEPTGQILGIVSFFISLLYEDLSIINSNMDPRKATGTALDDLMTLTAIRRLKATKGKGSGTAYGVEGTLIPFGRIVSVQGDPEARFITDADYIIGPGTNEVQLLQFSEVPDEGQFTLGFDGEETGVLNFDADAGDIEDALNGLPNLSDVTVAGDFDDGFTVTFEGSDGYQEQNLIIFTSSTLTKDDAVVSVAATEQVKGVLPNVEVDFTAVEAGAINGYAGSITVIETPVAGWESFVNPTDIERGKNVETDAEAYNRRERTLAASGSGTVEAIKSRLLEIDEVTHAQVYENDTDFEDAYGRPPHSFEAIVLGAENQVIFETIYQFKGAGIKSFGEIEGFSLGTDGQNHQVAFSRPAPVDIYIIINITTNADYPINGDEALKQALADYGDAKFSIGDDVLTYLLYCPVETVQGVVSAEILIGTAEDPDSEANVVIDVDEIANFDTSNIVVNEL
jgi:uncharacterized phage protein gp47/JayE